MHETDDYRDICVNAYKLNYGPFFLPIKRTLNEKGGSFIRGKVRKQGWEEMISLITFLGVKNYDHSFI